MGSLSNNISEVVSDLKTAYNKCLTDIQAGEQINGENMELLMKETFINKDGTKCVREVFYHRGVQHGSICILT